MSEKTVRKTPEATGALFRRERLESVLNEGWSRKLTTIAAPAGYGNQDYLKSSKPAGGASLRKYANQLLEWLPRSRMAEAMHFPASASLTPQEKRVLQFLTEGADNRSIAVAMSVSVETVKRHCRHVYRKLGVRNRKEAIEQYARRLASESFS